MKKVVTFFTFFTVLLFQAHGQTGNEWIDFNRTYFKIQTAQDGLYRVTYSDLQAAGVPVDAIDPTTFRLFHRGVEQAIVVAGEGDSQFHSNDYIDFYGLRNDGTLDANLYKPASAQPHKFYNLFCDTTAYFLTFGGIDGKRVTTYQESSSGLTEENYHQAQPLRNVIQQYATGATYGSDLQHSFFDKGEGWMGALIATNQTRSYVISGLTNGDAAFGKPTLEVLLVGRGGTDHLTEVSVGSGMRVLGTTSSSGFNATLATFPIEWSDIDATGNLTVSAKSLNTSDWISISYLRVIYPQAYNTFGTSQKFFYPVVNALDKSYVKIQNAGVGARVFDVTNQDDIVEVEGTLSTTLDVVIRNTASQRKILVTSSTLTPLISAVTFRQIDPADHDYIILTHPVLRVPAEGYADPVDAYAAYRASTAGGGFDTLTVDIQQVYDQFGYGERSPLGIYNMMKYLVATRVPRYFFIIGKGLDVFYDYNRDQGAFTTFDDLVPVAGHPASDNYFTVGLAGTTYEPAVPTGRLTASTSSQVAAYLNKVIETESMPINDLRKKNLLHLSGGIEEGEPERFRSYVNGFEQKARDYYLGGNVGTIAKRSRDIKLISIADEVNTGLGLVTFFGHSSSSTLDFDIGYVTDPVMGYNNPGKYPMMLIHGCNAGSFFIDDFLFGEDWILAKQKGAIGFVAHSSFGLEVNLKQYGDIFYSVAYNDSIFISRGIGDILKETSRRYMQMSPAIPSNITQAHQMILLGDPAVPLFGAKKSDLAIADNTISFESFDGAPITALTDSFKVNVVIRNLGQARPDTFRIEIERVLNDGATITYDSILYPVLYSDTISITIRKGGASIFGNNTFHITVDADDLIAELSEANNTASHDLFIPLNGTKNLFPRNFAIISNPEVTLSWQTTDVFSEERPFVLEIDTVNTFNSPYKKSSIVTATGLARQTISLLDQDSLVYYWRTKLSQPLPGENGSWEMSSFSRINNADEGWGQLHFQQYGWNGMEGLLLDDNVREIKFEETVTDLSITTFGDAHPSTNQNVSVKIQGVEFNLYAQAGGVFGCRDNSLNLIAFDKNSTAPYLGVPFTWYNRLERSCGREPWVINNFVPGEMVTGNNDDLIAYVDNVAMGDSVVLYSIGNASFSSWPMAAQNKLEELGISVTQLSSLINGEPVVIMAKKGTPPGSAKIHRASSSPTTAQLDVVTSITGGFSSGKMTSALIGPALSWQSFQESFTGKEIQDEVEYDIIGVKFSGELVTLFDNVSDGQDLSTIDAHEYPYLKVEYQTADELNLTSPQLDHWIVYYAPVPEGLLTYLGPRSTQFISEGSVWSGAYGFVNIGDRNFSDSLMVRYESFNHQTNTSESSTLKIKAPMVGDTTKFTVIINTQDKAGLNDVGVFVNPKIVAEQYYDNNVLSLIKHISVASDFFHPVMEVMVDGRRLIEGDFVAANPLIEVNVWDENRNFLKDNAEGMRLFLTYPCDEFECDPIAIDLSSEEVKWFPATATSDFRIEFRPKDLADGYYVLRVEAEDAQGNPSGVEPYRIGFVVQSASSVTITPPYPNPSSGEVKVSVVLSGDHVPSQVWFEIVDVNGKHIRDFSTEEVHIGVNQWSWNGKDTEDNPVRPGIYVFKMLFEVDGRKYQKNFKVVMF